MNRLRKPSLVGHKSADGAGPSIDSGKETGASEFSDGFYLVTDKAYANNFPDGADPTDGSSVIIATARFIKDGKPVSGLDIRWYFYPEVDYLFAFDELNQSVEVRPLPFTVPTNSNGEAIVKFGASKPFLGMISAIPGNNQPGTQTLIGIATVNRFYQDWNYPPLRLPFDDVATGGSRSGSPTFTAWLPADPRIPDTANVMALIWLQGKDRRQTGWISKLADARRGMNVPYSLLDDAGPNYMAYVLSDALGNQQQSMPVTFIGKTQDSAHPDRGAARTLDKPHLDNYADTVNSYSIAHGLALYLPRSLQLSEDDVVRARVYLNGWDEHGRAIFCIVESDAYVVAAIGAGQSIHLMFHKDNLSGYGPNIDGVPGSFEAEYYVRRRGAVLGLSRILDHVSLDTIP